MMLSTCNAESFATGALIIVLCATLIILAGLGAGRAVGLFNGSCGGSRPGPWSAPATPNNVMITFVGDVLSARDPEEWGATSDRWRCVYIALCERERDRVSEQQFCDSRGEAISPVLSASTYRGPTACGDRRLRSQHEYPWKDVESTWIGLEAEWYEHIDARTIVTDSRHKKHWRVDLVRESGAWVVCGFKHVRS